MKKKPRFGIGTVQWGLSYGVANNNGQTSSSEVNSILLKAHQLGICFLDTASQYGNAEAVIGKNDLDGFKIITKGPSYHSTEISLQSVDDFIQTFEASLAKMNREQIYGLLVHNANDLLVPGGKQLVVAMNELKVKEKVKKIGVSVYDGAQIDAVLNFFKPDIIQLPLNVFDQRLLKSGHLARLKEMGIEIHVRSVFLQGLLLMPLENVPIFFDPLRPLLSKWQDAVRFQGLNLAQAALGFVSGQPFVDVVVVGVESLRQLDTTFSDFNRSAEFDASGLHCNDPRFVNPANWQLS